MLSVEKELAVAEHIAGHFGKECRLERTVVHFVGKQRTVEQLVADVVADCVRVSIADGMLAADVAMAASAGVRFPEIVKQKAAVAVRFVRDILNHG